MPELLFLMYFTFSAYISANTMSVWHLVHRKSAFSHFNLLFPLFSQMFPFCLPLSLKLSLKPELQFLVESLQLHETCSLLHLPGRNCSLAASGLHMWGGTHVLVPLGRRSALQVGMLQLHTAQGRAGTTRQWPNAFLGSVPP